MWMFGKVNAEEKEAIVKTGWEIIRSLTPEEVDRLHNPDWDGKRDEEDEDDEFLLLYYDYDLSEVCENLLNHQNHEAIKKAAKIEFEKQQKLETDREVAAEEAFEHFDFYSCEDAIAEDSTIEDFNGWDRSENRFERLVFHSASDVCDDSLKLTFVVIFKEGSAEIDDTYINRH